MGVESPTTLELLGHDKNVQNHWARRLVAIIIDSAIISAALGIIALFVSVSFLVGFRLTPTVTFSVWWGAWWGFWFDGGLGVVLFLYFFLAEGLYARTIGKEIMGLRVERIDGKHVDFRSSFVRNISKIYWALLLVDVLVGMGTHGEASQKWSDRFIGTKVEAKTRLTIIG